MSNRRSLAWAVCALLSLGGTAHAQSTATASGAPARVEISPFVSAASGDETGVGAAIRWPLVSRIRLGLEVDTEFRSGITRGINSSANAVFDLPRLHRVRPYVTAGLGFEGYATGQPFYFGILTRRKIGPHWNVGGGLRVAITDRWGFRADVRYSDGFEDFAPDRLRVSWGATVGVGKRQ